MIRTVERVATVSRLRRTEDRRRQVESTKARAAPRAARSRITRLIVVALVALLLLVGTSAVGLVLLRHRVTVLAGEVEPESAANRQIRVAISDAQSGLRGYLRTGQTTFLSDYRATLPGLSVQLATLDRLVTDDESLRRLGAVQRSEIESWRREYADKIADGTITRTDGPGLDRANQAFEDAITANEAVATDLHLRTEEVVRQSRTLTTGAIIAILVIGVLGKLMVVGPGITTLKYIGPPLESLYQTVRSLRAGNADARADPGQGVLEIRAVASAFNELAESNQRQQDLLSERLRLVEFVHRLGLKMNASLDLDHVIDTSVRPIAEEFGTSTAWIRAWAGSSDLPGPGRRVQYPADRDLDSPTFLISCARRIALLAWERQVCYILGGDSPRDGDYITQEDHDEMLAFVGQVGVSSMIMVPVGDGADCSGYMALSRPRGAAVWNEVEQDALIQVGRDLGRTIRQARILKREKELVVELQALDVKKREFVSMVSHELRTPLSSIIGHLELVSSGDLGPVADTMEVSLNAMNRNGARLSRLIEDLLLLSRIEERENPATLVVLDVGELAGDVVQLHAESALLKSITVTLDVRDPVPVLGDPDEIDRVISNLLGNAIKFSRDGSSIEIVVSGGADGTRLEVTDHGMGISEHDQEQVFSRFFRSTNPAALLVPGTGLGLAITKLIIQKHRGEIELRSQPGVGSTFTVRLPTVASMQHQLDATEAASGDADTDRSGPLERFDATARVLPV